MDRRTGRAIVIEAKGTEGPRSLNRTRLRSQVGEGGKLTQTSPEWLKTRPERFTGALRNSTDPRDRRTADLLDDIIDNDAPYDVKIVNSRPSGQGGHGTRVDDAVGEIRSGGQVQDVEIDIVRPPPP